jgi:ATPase subunit of ABC transporter with duplicated ATPase domains
MKKVKKYYGTRLLLDIEDFKVYENDKIGIVGVNGAGKTTLLEIINKSIDYNSGELFYDKNTVIKYIPQLGEPNRKTISGKYASIFQVEDNWNNNMSGGEKTRFKLAEGFENSNSLLLVDEPTNNLDIDGIELVIKNFNDYKGPFIVVSHDRNFLDSVCNKMLEIDNAICKIYNGNYSKYLELKEMENTRKSFEYKEFINEKNRLTNIKRDLENRSAKVKTTPKRMGNSEARLHKMGGQANKAKLDRTAKSVEKRIEHLDEKEKPVNQDIIKIKILESTKPYNKILISGENLNKSYGENVIFRNAEFNINNGKKTALIGPNGSGKTTLINMILDKENINISKNVRIGYFSQTLNILDEDKTILENVMEESIHNDKMARLILARLLIKGEKVFEKLKILSGGERVKVSFAKIILEDINFLILDEPTNYLDINSLEVIEELLKNYDGSILFVSHDIRFIENICDELLIIDDKKIECFRGNYKEYMKDRSKKQVTSNEKNIENGIMILKNQISSLLSKISIEQSEEKKAEYDREYALKLEELAKLYKMIREYNANKLEENHK